MKCGRWYMLGILLFCIQAEVLASSTYFVDVDVMEDTSGLMSVYDVLTQAEWQYSTTHFSPGYSASTYWLSIPLDTKSCRYNEALYAVVTHPIIHYVDFYWVRGDSIMKTVQTGNLRVFTSREFPFNKFGFYLDNPQINDRILIRLRNEGGTLKAPVACFNRSGFFSFMQRGNIFSMLIFGIILFQLLHALLQSLLTREKILYWYSGFVFSVLAHQFLNKGYGLMFWPDSILYYYDVIRICTFPGIIFSLTGFAYHLLDIKQLFSDKVTRAIEIVMAVQILSFVVAFLPLPLFPHRFIVMTFFYSIIGITILGMIIFALLASRKGHQPAYYYLIAHIPIGVIIIFSVCLNYGLLPYRDFYYYLSLLTALYEVTVSLVALTIYIKRLQSVREELIPEIKPVFANSLLHIPIPESLREQYNIITNYFKQEHPYLNRSLKISDVSLALDIPVHELSKAINQCGKTHFFDFVNTYRIQYAQKLLLLPEHNKKYTVAATALQSGFNNRASFNTAFKRFTKITPSEYRKLHVLQESD